MTSDWNLQKAIDLTWLTWPDLTKHKKLGIHSATGSLLSILVPKESPCLSPMRHNLSCTAKQAAQPSQSEFQKALNSNFIFLSSLSMSTVHYPLNSTEWCCKEAQCDEMVLIRVFFPEFPSVNHKHQVQLVPCLGQAGCRGASRIICLASNFNSNLRSQNVCVCLCVWMAKKSCQSWASCSPVAGLLIE